MVNPPVANVGFYVLFAVLRVFNIVYDIISLPLYTIVQMPWKKRLLKSKVFAAQVDPEEPSSPWVSRCAIGDCGDLFDGITTVDQLLRRSIERFGSNDSLGYREVFGEESETQPDGRVFKKLDLGNFKWLSYTELDKTLDLIGNGFLASGVRPRQNVVIFADTRIEWMLAAQALLRLNVTVVTLYATLGEEGVIHGVNETESTHIVTSQDLLPKVVKSLPEMSSLTTIVYMKNNGSKTLPVPVKGMNLISWTELQHMGKTVDPELKGETPCGDDVAIVMYTSGSTGVPKGVMITHRNIVATARGFAPTLASGSDCGKDECFIAYLPLAHVFELGCESLALAFGARVGYSSPLTLTDKSTAIMRGQKGDATLLRPTVMAAVPLVLDRIKKSMTEAAHQRGRLTGSFFDWAISYKRMWQSFGYDTSLLNKVLFKKLRDAVGGRLRVIATGSAPLSVDTHSFIKAALGCTLVQGYGLTETSAGATVMPTEDQSFGGVGSPLDGCYVKLVDWQEAGYRVTDKPNPRGEIVIGGDSVAKGYYKNEELTRESFKDEQGMRWFYTGDIGQIHSNGTMKIIDRKKDLVKLQFGEYVSLGKVETELKTLPFVDNVCVIGNSFHSFLIALISPNAKALACFAENLPGKNSFSSVEELCNDREIIQAVVQTIIDHGKKKGLHKMEIPHKVKLCSEEWLPDSGLVTAAMKIRRKQIELFYQSDIDRLYSNDGAKSA